MYARIAFLSCSDTLSLVLLVINTSSVRIITYTARLKRILCTWQSALVTLTETLRELQKKKKRYKVFCKDTVVELVGHI